MIAFTTVKMLLFFDY